MSVLAVQTCVEITRTIDCNEARITETSFHIELHAHEVRIRDKRISMSHIYDMSCHRKHGESDEIGFLYLHTHRGVETYFVRDNPASFINAYKKLKRESRVMMTHPSDQPEG
ncbi:hypothetical protein [Paenibacillus thiaminolyticus]|uniref:Uncharacterized protein n=1 Tax=Paenibacillus thiaminolyticus TaxID=49283 RepID=A0A3A3GI47_PANTH|nr:hypothetical protein [Paenibacillus thiaminolyticus]RJG22796.1 hypothetical protein DQX05_16330 [Paenibacillus thiaminolyticus]